MTTDIKAALTDIAETNCNIIGLTCAAARDHIEQLEEQLATGLTDAFDIAVASQERPVFYSKEYEDLTLEEAIEVSRHGWRKVLGRTEMVLVRQIAKLLAERGNDLRTAFYDGYGAAVDHAMSGAPPIIELAWKRRQQESGINPKS